MKRITRKKLLLVNGLLLALLVLTALVCLHVGTSRKPVTLLDVLDPDAKRHYAAQYILMDWRLPRVLLAALVGGALSAAGVVFQALLRNPLADPYILGVSGGSALGAVLCISLGIQVQVLGFDSTFVFAFAGAGGALACVYSLSRVRGQVPTHTMLLAGVIVNSFCGAGIIFLLRVVNPEKVGEIFDWIIGSINAWTFIGYPRLAVLTGFVFVGFCVLYANGRTLNLLALGEHAAEQLGVRTSHSRLVLLIAASLLTACAVSMTGPIGFVGLIIPHALRLVLGPEHRLLLPSSLLFGATFLVACDTLGRILYKGRAIPVGVVTAMIGGPFFLYLLRRRQRRAGFSQEAG